MSGQIPLKRRTPTWNEGKKARNKKLGEKGKKGTLVAGERENESHKAQKHVDEAGLHRKLTTLHRVPINRKE